MFSEPVVPIGNQPWRICLVLLVFAGLFGAVGFRLHHLQVDQAENLADLGLRQRLRTWVIQAPRGNLYDGSGVPLAISAGTWSVYADPSYMDDRLRATVELSRTLGVSRDELRKEFESRVNGRRIAKGLIDERAEAVRQLALGGIYVRREFTRMYPEGGLAPHVMGFVLSDGTGGAGIEQEFNQELTGSPGRETMAVDALGHPSLVSGENRPAKGGAHIQLTIDAVIQRKLEAALAEAVDRHHPKTATGIVMRPLTGEILAMASWPTFDGTDLEQVDPNALRNNAIGFVYEPGSTMKPLIAGATVAEGLTRWNEVFNCEHGTWTYHFGKSSRTIHEGTGGHDMLTVVQGISLSDNILMAKLGLRMGPERLWRWENLFNFGRRTGINLPGEDGGLMLAHNKWTVLGSCMSIPMGHEIAVTPLQMAMAHAAIANFGLWQPPRLIKRLYQIDPQTGDEVSLPMPAQAASRQVFKPEDAIAIQDAMTHTMTDGTGRKAELEGYTCAGKTGTAEKLVGGHYSDTHHVGSFVCWAPAEVGMNPELLTLVVIDDPSQNGHYGSETAAPVVQKVLQYSLEYLKIPKRETPATPAKERAAARRRQ